MRILNQEEDKSLENIIVCLTAEEALELKSALTDLLKKPQNNHAHVSDFASGKEITVCIYNTGNDSFSERIEKLIRYDL